MATPGFSSSARARLNRRAPFSSRARYDKAFTSSSPRPTAARATGGHIQGPGRLDKLIYLYDAVQAVTGADAVADAERNLGVQFYTLKERLDEAIIERPRRLIRPQDSPGAPAEDTSGDGAAY